MNDLTLWDREEHMTDLELTVWLAEKVMGWKLKRTDGHPFILYRFADPTRCERLIGDVHGNPNFWQPLEDWNATMEVVAAMAKNPLHFWLELSSPNPLGDTDWWAHFVPLDGEGLLIDNIKDPDGRRSACLAAKAAIEAANA